MFFACMWVWPLVSACVSVKCALHFAPLFCTLIEAVGLWLLKNQSVSVSFGSGVLVSVILFI